MRIDCHVHISALIDGHGSMSRRLLRSLPFRFMRWRLGISGEDESTERAIEATLARTIAETDAIDAAVVLAFDAVYDEEGRLDAENTHLYVTNDYAIEVCRRHPKMLFGASVHPYRKDAVAEIERCAAAGAVLLKWLPIVQNFSPADERCIPVYEALAHFKLPLLSHTGGEKSLPNLNKNVMDPALLLPALQRGVTVIAAHCGTRSVPGETDYLPTFMRIARDHERFFGDTAALCFPTRSYAFEPLLTDPVVRQKIIHGSDWPIISIPPASLLGLVPSIRLMADRNWLRRDIAAKQLLGFDDAYFHRAGEILRLAPA
ncbi:MAG TPA: amidohydrolase family protein [Tepidisphaeraceae bacterium]|jgi:predicted TIM-barrel fold metal-dependent hydrolase|nr:amidohydrolase family protein [Tepidisphaeraceae bacterium]